MTTAADLANHSRRDRFTRHFSLALLALRERARAPDFTHAPLIMTGGHDRPIPATRDYVSTSTG